MATASRIFSLGVAIGLLAACGGGSGDLSGEELATEIGCYACHTGEDTAIAPTLHGIWGTEVVFDDGTTRTVDEAYVRESIREPGDHIVDGYDGRMPDFGLTDQEVERLVDYVRSLS